MVLSSGSLESGTGSSNSLRSANESISLGLVCSIDRNSPRVASSPIVQGPPLETYLKDEALRVPSYELTEMLYSSLEITANSIRSTAACALLHRLKCLPASPLDGERLSNGIRTVRHADWLKANRTTVYDLKAIPTREKSVKRRLQDCDAALASDDGPIFSTVAKLLEGTVSSANQSRLWRFTAQIPK